MQTKNLVIGFGVLVLSGAVFLLYGGMKGGVSEAPDVTAVESAMPVPGSNTPEMVVEEVVAPAIKEFTMTAYYDEKGKWYSLKEIAVKKGDMVRITLTNTKGMHDFVVDEYGIKKDLPLNEAVVVEFTADKSGEFVYYCSKPGHRDGGQWGTLRVTE